MVRHSISGLRDFHLQGEEIQEVMDLANEKYNNEKWREYATWADPTITTQFTTFYDGIDIATRPTIIAPISKKPLASVAGIEVASGRIPLSGKGFVIDQASIMEYEEIAAGTTDLGDYLLDKWLVKSETLLQGFHTQLNSWVYQGMSTGLVEVTDSMNLGLTFAVDFKVPMKNKFKAKGQAWFNPDGTPNTNADPIADLVRFNKELKRNKVVFDHFEMDEDYLDKVLMHPVVKDQIISRMAFTGTIKVVTDKEILLGLLGLGIPPIMTIDEMSQVDVDGVPVDLPASFEKSTVVAASSGTMFTIKNKPSFYHKNDNPNTTKIHTEGGKISAEIIFTDEPYAQKTSYEMWALPVPTNSNNIAFMKTDVATAKGTW